MQYFCFGIIFRYLDLNFIYKLMTQNIVALVVTINLRLNSLSLVTDYKRYTQIYDLPFYGLFSCKKNSPLGCVPSHSTS